MTALAHAFPAEIPAERTSVRSRLLATELPRADEQLALALVWDEPESDTSQSSVPATAPGTVRTPNLPMPAKGWAGRLAVAAVEVQLGQRPAAQLSRWVSQAVMTRMAAELRKQQPAARRLSQPPNPHAAERLSSPSPGVVEAVAIVNVGKRSRAVAMRLELVPATPSRLIKGPQPTEKWVATALDIL